jgi:hypothetical protein
LTFRVCRVILTVTSYRRLRYQCFAPFPLIPFHAFPVALNALGSPAPPSSMTFHEFVRHMQPTRSIPPSYPVECHLTLSFLRLLPHPPSVRSGTSPFGFDVRRSSSPTHELGQLCTSVYRFDFLSPCHDLRIAVLSRLRKVPACHTQSLAFGAHTDPLHVLPRDPSSRSTRILSHPRNSVDHAYSLG